MPKLRCRSGLLPPGELKFVSDEAPEATCLSNVCGSFRRLVRRFFPLHASLWQGGDGPWNLRSRDDRARVRLRRHHEMTLQPGRWPGRFPPDGAPIRPGPSPGGCVLGHLLPRHHPRRLFRLAVWVFATALAPCLCASEARPSDQGFQASGIRPSAITSTPSSGGRPLQRAGDLCLREHATPAPAPPRLTSHRQVYPRAGRGLG